LKTELGEHTWSLVVPVSKTDMVAELEAGAVRLAPARGGGLQSEQADPCRFEGGIPSTRMVLETFPPLDRGDEAVKLVVQAMVRAEELLQQDDVGTTEP
jgi:hypothetical protein